MGSIRRKSWFPIAMYLVAALGTLAILLFWAEKFYPNSSTDLIPRQTRWRFGRAPRQPVEQNTTEHIINNQKHVFMRIDQKFIAGNSVLIYRGLIKPSGFQIDLIVPELDPQRVYSYRLKISEAKDSFRLANRNFKLISAKTAALQISQLK